MPSWRGYANSSLTTWPSWPPRYMIASLLPSYQPSMADYGACVIPCPLLAGYGTAEILCCDWVWFSPGASGSLLRASLWVIRERTLPLASAPEKG